MTRFCYSILLVAVAASLTARAQQPAQDAETGRDFAHAAQSIEQKLSASVAELNALRERVVEEKIPLTRRLSALEDELTDVRASYQQTTRLLDSRTLDLNNLRNEIKARQEEATYLSNLLGEYIRNFETRLHIAELQRYEQDLEQARSAADNAGMSQHERYEAQAQLLAVSLQRLEDVLSGTQFKGTAVDADGMVETGTFVMVGPAAIFRSHNGEDIGTAEQRLGSLQPAIVAFKEPAQTDAAAQLIQHGKGELPFDPTLGNAHKIAETKETLLEHIKKGGPVMYPIFGMAGAALLVALFKWLSFLFVRTPSRKKLNSLLDSVANHNKKEALAKAQSIGGPVGQMLTVGVEHIKEPRELIEEVMYEKVMATRIRLQRFLPLIAICAASAPLLGLLGTVTGIINTFKLITVFGSGDVKTLSGGISEALITTEFGLIVAIPSLLLHAFLARKARGVVDQMEKAAVALINQISKNPYKNTHLVDEEDDGHNNGGLPRDEGSDPDDSPGGRMTPPQPSHAGAGVE